MFFLERFRLISSVQKLSLMGFYLILLFVGIVQSFTFFKKQGKGLNSNLSTQRSGLFGGRNREQMNEQTSRVFRIFRKARSNRKGGALKQQNTVFAGSANSNGVRGDKNTISANSNYNAVQGSQNQIKGNANLIQGSSNYIEGSGNSINNSHNIIQRFIKRSRN